MGRKWTQLKLLMWKNYRLVRRRPTALAFEILLPVLLALLIFHIRRTEPSTLKPADMKQALKVDALEPNLTLGYSPANNEHINKIMEKLAEKHHVEVKGFTNGAELQKNLLLPKSNSEKQCGMLYNGGIQFDDALGGSLSDNLTVTIRLPSDDHCSSRDWHTQSLSPPNQPSGPLEGFAHSSYESSGYLTLQHAVAFELIQYREKEPGSLKQAPQIKLHEYPYPSYENDRTYSKVSNSFSLIVLTGFMYCCVNIVRAITWEKEMQLKESMKIMGLAGWIHWLAWFLRTFPILMIINILITLLFTYESNNSSVLHRTHASVFVVFLMLYTCCLITFSFCISTFCAKANTSVAIASVLFFLTYLPYTQQTDKKEIGPKLAACMCPNSAFVFGLSRIIDYANMKNGIRWNNLFEKKYPGDLSFGLIMSMLVFDTFLYFLLALYIEAIFPGEFGTRRPWYFLCSGNYWYGHITPSDNKVIKKDSELFEPFTGDLRVGIYINNLSKTFGYNKVVNKLNLKMYEGHITVLLGHNGAGKTTTMAMLTGMYPPTSGTAIVDDYDIRTHLQKVRESMGICLQHNVLFDMLTVKEHLHFFTTLKGLCKRQIKGEINVYLKLLKLEDKQNTYSGKLSGGMKRKLSVGIALCGYSRIIMLDEPTAGMDPSARRTMWNILQKQKEDRTILLTTHYMDEADLLGDRIAIMSAGNIECCGSSFFLKQKFGNGYYLIMDVSENCNPSRVTSLLQRHIPNTKIYSHVASQLTYLLPNNESGKFERLFRDLDDNTADLDINSYGISLTTLEEIFMMVGHYDTQPTQNTNNQIKSKPQKYLTGCALIRNQMFALMQKKFIHSSRSWILHLIQILIPLVFLVFTIKSFRISEHVYPPLPISLNSYKDPITLVSGDNTSALYMQYLHLMKPMESGNIISTILKERTMSPSAIKSNVIGASFEKNISTAWFNGDFYHSGPLSLGVLLDVYYKQYANEKYSINFVNEPLPISALTEINKAKLNDERKSLGISIAMNLSFAMIISASCYILFYIKERYCKSKHLQFVSGVNPWIFWISAFIFDLMTYLILNVAIILLALLCLQENGYRTADELILMAVMLCYYGFAVLPLTYLLSHMWQVPSTGYSRLSTLGIFTGVIGMLVILSLGHPPSESAKLAHSCLLYFPYYAFTKGIFDTVTHRQKEHNYYSMESPGIGQNIVSAVIAGVVCFLFNIFIEYGFLRKPFNKIRYVFAKKTKVRETAIDSDVLKENKKVAHLKDYSQYALVLRNLTKHYGGLRAVNGICIAIKPTECFGLLGVNGAGKTTTFEMMTGDTEPTSGSIYIHGVNIKTNRNKAQKMIGYCPQFDALLDNLTAKETLRMFCLIRGVHSSQCKSLIEQLAQDFDFKQHLNKQVHQLSGGNKRKLSAAVAVVGDPVVIFLDEPTAGMDPATRRHFWTAIAKLRDSGKSIVLTSHSMEECEALCTRVAIMVNGTFQCLGSIQRLKNKFAQGHALTIKSQKTTDPFQLKANIAAIDDFLRQNFEGIELKEQHQELLTYRLKECKMPWSQMFKILESSKKTLSVEDYSLGQCSLEEVFLSFTQRQK